MAFVPGSGLSVQSVTAGPGIQTTGTGAVTVAAKLAAGPGITLTTLMNDAIQISAGGVVGNVTDVIPANGSGINASHNLTNGIVTLSNGIAVGNGLQLVPSTTTPTLTINNTQNVDSLKGAAPGSSNATGITVTQYTSGQNKTFGVSANLQAGSGISITPTSALPSNSGLTIANTGVNSVAAGNAGITIGGTAQAPTISNTGVTSLTAGAGVALTGSTGNITISAGGTGVASVGAGTGISITGTSNAPIVNNTGVTSLTAGYGLNVSNSTGNSQVSLVAGGLVINSQSFNSPIGGITLSAQYNVGVVIPTFDPTKTLMSVRCRFNGNTQAGISMGLVVVGGGGNTGIPSQSISNIPSKAYDNIYFLTVPTNLYFSFNNSGMDVNNFEYSIEVVFTQYTNPVMNYNATLVAAQTPAYTELVCGGYNGSVSLSGPLEIDTMPTYAPTPVNNTAQIATNIVPVLYNTTTNQLVISSSPLIRYFRVNTPSSTGSPVNIVDPQGNLYTSNDWVCCVAGFANVGSDRTYQCFTVPYNNAPWQVEYDQAGGAGSVWILAINRALLGSVQY